MTDEQAALLSPCRRAIALAPNNIAILKAIEAESASLAPVIARGELSQDMLIDAIYESVDGSDLVATAGSGAVNLAIATGLKRGWANGHTQRISVLASEFTANLEPIDFLVKGVLLTGYVYSLTARPGSGKTAVTILLSLCVSTGADFAGRKVKLGGVLYFAGENPEDVKRRWLVACQRYGVDDTLIDNVWFVPGVYKFSEIGEFIHNEMDSYDIKLVIVDTTAAYFEGEDDNSNTEQGEHAKRMRDVLAGLPSRPTVLINAHPAKGASDDNLVPRGGGAFEASIDGNLYCRKIDSGVVVHHTAKFRGVEFDALNFQIESDTHPRIITSDGDYIHIPVAKHISDAEMDSIEKGKMFDEDEVLQSIIDDPICSIADRAKVLGWMCATGEPHKSKVFRCIEGLKRSGLVTKGRGGRLSVTKAGTAAAKRLRNGSMDDGDETPET